ncbi:uncharacterized protein [Chironomus tepperi]|uniref:uncharacterized protein n=1 Tax=Chironomus tepperi TaxID=113505 RepID=UPI00391F9A74
MSFNIKCSTEEDRSKIMDQLKSLSPETCMSEDPLDQVSDLSFERMEKLCELMDSKDLKGKLPTFLNEQEETDYILSMENYFKSNKRDFSEIDSIDEAMSVIEDSDSSDSSISVHLDNVEINDTLDEVDFVLALHSQGISTPKRLKLNSCNQYLKAPATERHHNVRHADRFDMRNVTLRKKNSTSSVPRYPMNRSLSLSPSCRTQAAVSHSQLLSPFHY